MLIDLQYSIQRNKYIDSSEKDPTGNGPKKLKHFLSQVIHQLNNVEIPGICFEIDVSPEAIGLMTVPISAKRRWIKYFSVCPISR